MLPKEALCSAEYIPQILKAGKEVTKKEIPAHSRFPLGSQSREKPK